MELVSSTNPQRDRLPTRFSGQKNTLWQPEFPNEYSYKINLPFYGKTTYRLYFVRKSIFFFPFQQRSRHSVSRAFQPEAAPTLEREPKGPSISSQNPVPPIQQQGRTGRRLEMGASPASLSGSSFAKCSRLASCGKSSPAGLPGENNRTSCS